MSTQEKTRATEEENEVRSDGQQTDQAGTDTAVAHPVQFEEGEDETDGQNMRLDLILDVALPVRVELGQTALSVEELLELGPGSVVELDKLAGEPVDLYVRDTHFARGEVVVVDDNFGLRITDIRDHRQNLNELQP